MFFCCVLCVLVIFSYLRDFSQFRVITVVYVWDCLRSSFDSLNHRSVKQYGVYAGPALKEAQEMEDDLP